MLPTDPHETLKTVFGFDAFRPGQERIVEQVLQGNSALAVFPTGSGKSLCYQLPALMLDGLTIVVSPLIALMKDQVDFLQERGVRVARLDSTLSAEESRTVYSDVRAGALKLLYVAPERISNERFFAAIEGHAISLMVIDEAHCISEWGHNFRPEYLKLAIAAKALKVERVLALTATATPTVVEDILREFEIAPAGYVNTGFHRPNLFLAFSPTAASERMEILRSRLEDIPAGPTIVYVTLQKTAEEVAAGLARWGYPAKAYHAGMKSDVRANIQDWFMASADGIVVATIAFGMGIDKSDIRRVFHYNLPKTLENYSQEIGRAGRDGKASYCEVLGGDEDLMVLENFIFGDTPTEEAVGALVEYVLKQEDEFDISMYHLSRQTDIRPLVLSTLLTYLELEGVIKFTAPFYSEYKFRYVEKKEWVLAAFKGEPGEFLRSLLAQATAKTMWSYLNLDTVVQALGCERSRIVKAFNHLEETGKLEVGVTGLRQGMRLLQRGNAAEVTAALMAKVARNEAGNLQRTRQVVEFLNVDDCKTRHLLKYFGEELGKPCGHCGYCQSGTVTKVVGSERGLSESEAAEVERFLEERPVGSKSAREAARYLCGIATPQTGRDKKGKAGMFGVLEEAPFQAVMRALEVS